MSFFRRRPPLSVGIDFGTTTSRLCYFDNNLRVQVPPKVRPLRSLVTPIPQETTRTCVWQAGERALDYWAHYSCFKLQIGNMAPIELTPRREINEVIAFRPEVLAAHLIWALHTQAGNERKELRHIHEVTVTIPAEWNMIQRQATVLAAKMAGFVNVNLIEEPVAAFLAANAYHPSDTLKNAANTLVFDYGGGTLDITVIQRPDKTKPPFVNGRATEARGISGEALDEILCKTIVGEHRWSDITTSDRDRRFLANIVRQLKETLNPKDRLQKAMAEAKWPEQVKLPDSKMVFETGELGLSFETLQKVVTPIAEKAIQYVDYALQSGKITARQIQAVILVGGSSYLRSVQDMIEKKFPDLTWGAGIYLEQPEEIVAMGAALYQSALDRGEESFRLRLPMTTSLLYQVNENGVLREKALEIGSPENTLPFAGPKFPLKQVSIPKELKAINWKVIQEHTYSQAVPDVIEQVVFSDLDGHSDHLVLKYKFDQNACLQRWEPELVRTGGKPLTGSPRRYDWNDKDPFALAREFAIDHIDKQPPEHNK